MATSLAVFLLQYPEFAPAPASLVSYKLQEAEVRASLQVFGTARDTYVYLLCARLLAISPQGRDMKLVSDDGRTAYDADLEEMRRAYAVGWGRVC